MEEVALRLGLNNFIMQKWRTSHFQQRAPRSKCKTLLRISEGDGRKGFGGLVCEAGEELDTSG